MFVQYFFTHIFSYNRVDINVTSKKEIYKYKKRISDDELLKIQEMINNEVEKRKANDERNLTK